MKLNKLTLIGITATALYGLVSCDKHDHPHDGDGSHHHEKGEHKEGDGHDHDQDGEHKEGDGHDHDQDGEHKEGDGHEHAHAKKAGPSGGRVLTEFEPHAEFFVLPDRKVRITFVDDDFKAVPAGDQVAFVIAGERAAPTELSFAKEGNVLVSDKALPVTDSFPVIVQIAAKAGEAPSNAKFQANMLDCPSCDYLEYACVCDHDGEHKH